MPYHKVIVRVVTGTIILLTLRPLKAFDSRQWHHDQTVAEHWRYKTPCCQVQGTRSWVAQYSR